MSKFNLSEAAAEILAQSKAKAGSESFGVGKPQMKTPGQEIQDLGTAGHKMTDPNYDAAKSLKKATLPTGDGVASEPMKKLSGEPQQSMGNKPLATSPEGSETSCDDKVNRKKGPTAQATASANPGATKPFVPESSGDEDEWIPDSDEDEWEDEELEEATIEEVMEDLENLEDEIFEEKYGKCKDDVKKMMDDEDEEDEEEKEAMKKAKKEKFKEDVNAMLSGENLSEEFKEKASMIFEAAVEARVEEIAQELEEKFTNEFEEALETVKEDFAEKLDSYLDYVVENWMEENQLAIEKGLRSEIVEDFIGALRNVFVEHYIDIPEEEVSIVEELADKVESLEDQINEEILKNIELKKSLSEQEKISVTRTVCEGLTLSQAEKIKSLAKSIEFVSEEDFQEKLETIKESYFPSEMKQASSDSLNEAFDFDEDNTTKVVDPLIEQYANIISKTTKF